MTIALLALAVSGCPEEDGAGPAAPASDEGAAPLEDSGVAEDQGSAPDDPGKTYPDLPRYQYEGDPGPEDLFQHGVASGDPLPGAVVVWTRVTPEGVPAEVEVFWEVADDPAMAQRVAAGTTKTGPDRDYTVHVDVTGLLPGATWFYRFHALGRTSPVGRTRTPKETGMYRLRLAVVCGSNMTRGYFHAFANLAKRADLDAVVHLGDYFYEYGAAGFVPERDHEPPYEAKSLGDYRTRYAQYRRDPDLQEVHRQHPFVVVWDDHESANNSWVGGAENHSDDTEGPWELRKTAAVQAWHEWMPVREQPDRRIFRTLRFGTLADLIVLDTRLFGRDAQPNPNDKTQVEDPSRSILGDEQETWAVGELESSGATWRLLASQVMLAPLLAGGALLNNDQWDGYPASRRRILAPVEDGDVRDVVVLSGDIHSSWAADIPGSGEYDPATGEGSIAVELVTPAVTSGFPLDPIVSNIAVEMNPHFKFSEVLHNGYYVLDVDAVRAQAAWFFIEDVKSKENEEVFAAAFSVLHGTTWLQQDPAPADPPAAPPLAPPAPGGQR